MKLNVNIKLINQLVASVLAGTIVLSLTGCSSDKKYQSFVKEGEKLTGYTHGYYLDEEEMDMFYVVHDKNGILRIIDKDNQSVYSSKKYKSDKTPDDLYKYMDENLVKAADSYKDIDFINLEKLINGENTYSDLPQNESGNIDNLIEPNKWYSLKEDSYSYHADLAYVELLFIDGKVDRICRRIIEESRTDERLIDIIDGRNIYPRLSNRSNVIICKDSLEDKDIEFVLITDMFNNISKETFTGDEIVELYYSIAGKSKEEAKEIINNMFSEEKGKELVLTPTE